MNIKKKIDELYLKIYYNRFRIEAWLAMILFILAIVFIVYGITVSSDV